MLSYIIKLEKYERRKYLKRVKLLIVFVIVIILITGIVVLIQNHRNTVVIERDSLNVETVYFEADSEQIVQLSAPADSEEEAKEIAEMYGITYIGYYRGYGQYETSEDVNALKEYGLEKNLPDLEVLYKSFTK